jgi:hypothetical protein
VHTLGSKDYFRIADHPGVNGLKIPASDLFLS